MVFSGGEGRRRRREKGKGGIQVEDGRREKENGI
jgi:hypothetical protein